MIKKPLNGRTPNGKNALRAMEAIERATQVSHLRMNEPRVEGDMFIPRAWRMRGYVLCPNITNQGLLYRGDTLDAEEFHNTPTRYSMASLKEMDMADKLYRRMRWEDLALVLLRSHPIYRLLSMGIKLPGTRNEYFRISSSVLLHSYGISSPYISLTSDKDIALFYAVTDYDEKTRKYVPTKKEFGVLSCYQLREPFNPTSRVFPIGLQVFERPGLNKEFSCKLRPFEDFYELPEVTGLVFYQDRYVSEYMLDKYEGGELLCPQNDILTNKIKQTDGCLLQSTFKRFLKRYPQFEMDMKTVQERYKVVDDIRDMLMFSYDELIKYHDSFEYWWYEFCKKILFEVDKKLDRGFFESIPYDSYYSRYFRF